MAKTDVTPENLRSLAVETLRREIPEELRWLPLGEAPVVRWASDRGEAVGGEAVDPVIIRGWLVAAAEGEGQPVAKLVLQSALFEDESAADLALWLLQAWIHHDTYVPEMTEARRAELYQMAKTAAELAARLGRGGTDPEERFRQLVDQAERRPEPSALPYAALLAVVSATGDERARSEIDRYLEQWDQTRPQQVEAMQQVSLEISQRLA